MTQIFKEIQKIIDEKKQAVLILVVEKTGHGPAKPGFKMLITSEGKHFGTIGGGKIEHLATQKATELMKHNKFSLIKYWLSEDETVITDKPDLERTGMMCGGTITLFFEPIGTAETLYILGAGHIGKALLAYFDKLDFNVTIFDTRAEILDKIDNQKVNKILLEDYSQILEKREFPADSYFIIATHSHDLDYIALKQIFQSNLKPKFIGALASKRKAAIIKSQLKENFPDSANFHLLYMPVGLNIGGSTPDEIALSISAQIQQIKYNKTDLNF